MLKFLIVYFPKNSHKYMDKVMFLSAACDFYILGLILPCESDAFQGKNINLKVKFREMAYSQLHVCEKWTLANYIFVKKIP